MAELTPSLAAVNRELQQRMGPIGDKGDFNCRPFNINGKSRPDLGWSEHSWANAIDYDVYGYSKQKPYVDMLNQMRSEGFPVGTVLWASNRPSDHTDHIHTEGDPKYGPEGPPPCAGGAPIETVPSETVTGGGTRTPSEVNDPESEINWWDWLLDPTGTTAKAGAQFVEENIKPLFIRIGFGLLAVMLIAFIIWIVVKEFAESQGVTLDNLVSVATKGRA